MLETPHVGIALLAGLLSFFSPCVLAVAPGYLGILTGSVTGQAVTKKRSLWVTLLFVRVFRGFYAARDGFFPGWPITADLPRILGGFWVCCCVFGLHQMGLLKLGLLYWETAVVAESVVGLLPLLTGMAFALVGRRVRPGTWKHSCRSVAPRNRWFWASWAFIPGDGHPFFLLAVAMTDFSVLAPFSPACPLWS